MHILRATSRYWGRTGRPGAPGDNTEIADALYIEEEHGMKRYVCGVCGYVYDPEKGDPDNDIAPGTSFDDLPDDWICPECGAGKEDFEPEN